MSTPPWNTIRLLVVYIFIAMGMILLSPPALPNFVIVLYYVVNGYVATHMCRTEDEAFDCKDWMSYSFSPCALYLIII